MRAAGLRMVFTSLAENQKENLGHRAEVLIVRLKNLPDYQRPPPPPPPPLRGAFGRASLTVSGRPSRSAPFMPAMASRASVSLDISTKPKPRDRPVSRSMITCAESTLPKREKASRMLSSVVVNGRFPTKIFTVVLLRTFTLFRSFKYRQSSPGVEPGERNRQIRWTRTN